MSTIASHLTVATILAVSHAGHLLPSAAAQTNGQSAAQSAGAIGLVFVVILVALLATMARAARGMATLMSGFLQVAASITSTLFGVLVVVVIAVLILLRH
jgi:hypothetical protein